MVIVFIVLAALCIMIGILSKVLGSVSGKVTGSEDAGENKAGYNISADHTAPASAHTGGLVLNNVDERTAAMVMAIVSHETKTPLDQLVFKSISARD